MALMKSMIIGFDEIASAAAGFAKMAFIVFLILFVISGIMALINKAKKQIFKVHFFQ